MNWYYAAGGQQQGPVDDAQLDALIQAGTVTQDTLIWREGMAGWQPLRQARPTAGGSPALAAPPLAAPPIADGAAGEVVCAECGKLFTRDNAIQYGTTWVCAACKPVFLQKLREGTPLTGAPGALVSEQDILTRDYKVEIGDCVERAWKVVTANLGLVIGASVLVFLVGVVGWVVSMVVGLIIPLGNILVSFLYTGPLLGGYLWLLLCLARGEPAGVGDAFAGFNRRLGQLMLASLVQGILSLACFVPVLAVVMGAGIMSAVRRGGAPPNMEASVVIALVVLSLAGFAGVVYLTIIWTHSLLLIIDKGYDFWGAMQLSRRMVSKRWWMTFLFLFVGGILYSVGAFVCLIGLLVSIPLYYAMRVCFYDDNFRDLAPAAKVG
jgi:uncharacterized membrane protein